MIWSIVSVLKRWQHHAIGEEGIDIFVVEGNRSYEASAHFLTATQSVCSAFHTGSSSRNKSHCNLCPCLWALLLINSDAARGWRRKALASCNEPTRNFPPAGDERWDQGAIGWPCNYSVQQWDWLARHRSANTLQHLDTAQTYLQSSSYIYTSLFSMVATHSNEMLPSFLSLFYEIHLNIAEGQVWKDVSGWGWGVHCQKPISHKSEWSTSRTSTIIPQITC